MRVTKRMLESRLKRINQGLGQDYWLENAPHYGGWRMTNSNGSTIIYGRVPAREILAYLDGVNNGIDMMEGAYNG